MKPKTLLSTLAFITVILWSQCFPPEITELDQPGQVEYYDTFAINMVITGYGAIAENADVSFSNPEIESLKDRISAICTNDGGTEYRLILSMQLWYTWDILDSILFFAKDTIVTMQTQEGFFVHDKELSRDMDSIMPPQTNQKWWVAVSDSLYFTDGTLWIDPQVVVGNNPAFPNTFYQLGYKENDYLNLLAGSLLEEGIIFCLPPDTVHVINTNDYGYGSLRQAVNDIMDGGVIYFDLNPGDTIKLDSSLMIRKNLSMVGPDTFDIFVMANNHEACMGIFSDSSSLDDSVFVDIENLSIINSGRGIYGTYVWLNIHNCIITGNEAGLIFENCNVIVDSTKMKYNDVGLTAMSSYLEVSGSSMSYNNLSGLHAGESEVFLSGTRIAYNQQPGIENEAGNTFVFDTLNRCNLYLNGLGLNVEHIGRDVHSSYPLHLVLDTFSVLYPTVYYLYDIDSITWDINYGMIEQYKQDMFVAMDGDDDNSGLSWDDAFRTIDRALASVMVDYDVPNTIHLSEGTFNLGHQVVPQTVSFKGQGMDKTILDVSWLWIYKPYMTKISDMIVPYNAAGPNIISDFGSLLVENVAFDSCITGLHLTEIELGMDSSIFYKCQEGIVAGDCELEIFNSAFISNDNAVMMGNMYGEDESHLIKACFFVSNGQAVSALGNEAFPTYLNIVNSLFVENESEEGIICGDTNVKMKIVNSTIAMNYSTGAVRSLGTGSSANIINSIIYDNPEPQIEYDGDITISYSDIQGGWEGDGNIDGDPDFDVIGTYPFSLLAGSPCIGAGNPDTTGLDLPVYDLAGNPRITDERIDMGAYECLNTGIENKPGKVHLVSIYPNPVDQNTICRIAMKNPGHLCIDIYNQNGQLLSTNIDSYYQVGEYQIPLNIKDLKSGVYIVLIAIDGEIQSRKIVKL